MAAPLDRTWFNTLIDDDGSGTTGTIWDKAQIDGLLDSIDAALGPCAVPDGGPGAVQFNDGGILGSDPGFAFDKVSRGLTLPGGVAGAAFIAGVSPAQSGVVRLPNEGAVVGRNAANAADVPLIKLGSDNTVYVGDGATVAMAGQLYAGGLTNAAGGLQVTGVAQFLTGQLNFPATAVPSSDVHTLDDYHEGTWTPTLSSDGGASGQGYVAQSGMYTKVGNVVICTGRIVLSAVGTLAGGAVFITMPFWAAGTNHYMPGPVIFGGLARSIASMTGRMAPGTNSFYLLYVPVAGTNGMQYADPGLMAASTEIEFAVAYQT